MATVRPGKRTTLKDVASRAGVSLTTASLVLNDKAAGSIPATTQQRVFDAARDLGYRPNAMAAGLRRQHSRTIGFISDQIATSDHAGKMVKGAHDAARKAGMVLLMVDTEGEPDTEQMGIEAMLERRVDAVVYAAMFHQVIDPPDEVREVPAVLLDARTSDASLPSVVPDEVGGARTAVSHLVEAGHRMIGFVQNVEDIPASLLRLQGYHDALAAAHLTPAGWWVSPARPDVDGAVSATLRLLDRPDRPTALFCFNDVMAAGAARAAHHLGLSIPTDLSLVGFDNHELVAPLIDPPITTIQLPHYEMGRWAVDHVLTALHGGGTDIPEQHLMECPLVSRDSVAPPWGA